MSIIKKSALNILRTILNPISPNILHSFSYFSAKLQRILRIKIFLIQTHHKVFTKRFLQFGVIDQKLMVTRLQKMGVNINVIRLISQFWQIYFGNVCQLIA